MRVFYVGSNLPEAGHTVRAPTVVTREALGALRTLGHEVTFQPLLPADRDPQLTPGEEQALAWVRSNGITLLDTLHAPPGPKVGTRWRANREAIMAAPELFNPAYALRDELARRIDAAGADVVLHVWSSHALAACSATDRPVFAYYGNPDHKALDARFRHPELFGLHRDVRSRIRLRRAKLANRNRRRVNVRLMRSARWSANVCAVDAEFFAREGHPNAFYIQNMWVDLGPGASAPAAESDANKIVGNLGALYGTGNAFGLFYLGREVLPALDRRLGGRYSIHLYGAGELPAAVAQAVNHPSVVVRGFVDDIDAELRSSKVFLILNNNNPDFVVGHTRILHAWSLGLCLVAHRNMALAMPEIVHGENALLGSSGEEIAEHVAAVLEDTELRRRIGDAGRRMFEREFLPPTVMGRVMSRIESDLRV